MIQKSAARCVCSERVRIYEQMGTGVTGTEIAPASL